MRAILTLTVGVVALFAMAYGIYLMFITILLSNFWYTGAVAYLVFAASIGSGTLIRMINE